MDSFLFQIADMLEVDQVDILDEFEKFECWDSLTILSIIALCQSEKSIIITAKELTEAKTISGLLELLEKKG